MNNRIQFRVYLAEQKQMLYSEDWGNPDWNQLKSWQQAGVLMQVTGLTDVEGLPVYEGDFVEVYNTYKEESFRGVVRYGNGGYFIQKDDLTSHFRWINYDIRVIGNTFENPKLLIEKE